MCQPQLPPSIMEQPISFFPYRPLRTSPIEIRLVLINPGSFSAPLHCNLEYALLDDKPKFEALSYVWGDPNDRLPIWLDGKRFNVTRNLESALRHMRQEDTVRMFWIDAICINQSDVKERGQQVQSMAKIYQTAIQTTVWLGRETENTSLAFGHIFEQAEVVRQSQVSKKLVAASKQLVILLEEHIKSKSGMLAKSEESGRIHDTSLFLEAENSKHGRDEVFLRAEIDRYDTEIVLSTAKLREIRQELEQDSSSHAQASGAVRDTKLRLGGDSTSTLSLCHKLAPFDSENNTENRSQSYKGILGNPSSGTSEAKSIDSDANELAVNIDRVEDLSDTVLQKIEEGICDILEMPWWERVWVVQEIGMSQDVIFQCGNFAAGWSEVYSYFSYAAGEVALGTYPLVMNILSMRKNGNSFIMDPRRSRMDPQRNGMELLEILQRFRYCQATNPLDKVYALLGLAEDFGSDDFRIDYALEPKQLYIQVARTIIEQYKSLDILGYVDSEEDTKEIQHLELPSWVPNWWTATACSPFPNKLGTRDNTKQFYTASGSSSVSTTVSYISDTLILAGFVYDTVIDVCQEAEDIESDLNSTEFFTAQQQLTVIQQWEERALEASENHDPYIPNCTRIEAFWRTVIADEMNESRAPREAEQLFNVWSGRTAAPEGDLYFTEPFVSAVFKASTKRKFCISQKNYMALAPARTRKGDLICVVYGSQTPLIIREHNDYYSFVGACYVHGIMDGESMQEQEQEPEKYKTQSFAIR